ncbi:MAG: hypothetical protein OH338_01510 [Candidatus Parvarchaeota archaeon]|nr:hypothetical protein [Candidatus Parvarchaeota archaeon]MCW1295900.1 hypothetical protein [Candidatus Parvarchaeum tengchongense]MCW1312092.1 hypothetical protein [Candidatus Parvarchaeum tengchongense]
MRPGIFILGAFVLFLVVGSAHAASLSASFNALNSSLSINQYEYFNLSAYFPVGTNYTIFLNNTPVLYGNLPANYSSYKILHYNISNMPYGKYYPSVHFSAFNFHLNSTVNLDIKASPDFTFIGDYKTTEIIKNYSLIKIGIKNNGNTPLKMNWSLPIFRNISISLTFNQTFRLDPGSNITIPINLSLQKGYQDNILIPFTSTYQNYSITKSYETTLIKPIINMSFYNLNVTQINSTRELWVSYIKNYNNVPLNITIQFSLEVNGSTFQYSVPYELEVNATKIEVTLPKSTIENVRILYESQNLSKVDQDIFTLPKPPSSTSLLSIIDTLGYVILTVVSILILALIHLRFNKRSKKK